MTNRFRLALAACSLCAAATAAAAVPEEATAETSDALKTEFFPSPAAAYDKPEKVHVAFETRFDFDWTKPQNAQSEAGFHGRYLNMMVNGEIVSGLSYNWRQRFNKFGDFGNDVFSATDWIYLTYRWGQNQNWAVSGGKQVVAVGGYEYDAAPINMFYSSLWWTTIACYQFGVSGSYTTNNGNHTILAQLCNSMFQSTSSRCFSYNLMWQGHMGFWSTIWSVNALEYRRGKFANYIALGNRFDFCRSAFLELDIINRYSEGTHYLFGDYSLIGKLQYNVSPQFGIFAKGGYERFRLEPGTPASTAIEKPFIGAGVEIFPLKRYHDLRLHAAWDMNHTLEGQRFNQVQVGCTLKVNILSVR